MTLREESREELIGAFLQEMLGSLIMFLLFFPIGTYLGDTYHGWLYHFIAVIIFDIITIGAAANPCVCFALFITQKMDKTSTIVRVAGEIVAGFLAFPIMKLVTPSALFERIEGPELAVGVDTFKGAFAEMCLTYLFVLVALFVINYITDPNISRPVFAITLRFLIILGGSITGASMNSMIGISWAWYTNRLFSTNYNIVYTIAPNIGAFFASIAYMFIVILTKRTKRIDVKAKKDKTVKGPPIPAVPAPDTHTDTTVNLDIADAEPAVAIPIKVAVPVTPSTVRRRATGSSGAGAGAASGSRGRSQSRSRESRGQTPSSGGKKNGERSARKGIRSASKTRKPSSAKKTK